MDRPLAQYAVGGAELYFPGTLYAGNAPQLAGHQGGDRPGGAVYDRSKSHGPVYFRDVDPVNHSAEYGIFIGEEDARGQGFGSETARLFTEFGFARLGLHRISLRLLEENLPARRSYEHAGFREEGTFRDMVLLAALYRNVVFMARLAGE